MVYAILAGKTEEIYVGLFKYVRFTVHYTSFQNMGFMYKI